MVSNPSPSQGAGNVYTGRLLGNKLFLVFKKKFQPRRRVDSPGICQWGYGALRKWYVEEMVRWGNGTLRKWYVLHYLSLQVALTKIHNFIRSMWSIRFVWFMWSNWFMYPYDLCDPCDPCDPCVRFELQSRVAKNRENLIPDAKLIFFYGSWAFVWPTNEKISCDSPFKLCCNAYTYTVPSELSWRMLSIYSIGSR
jgi:hypothetical protein